MADETHEKLKWRGNKICYLSEAKLTTGNDIEWSKLETYGQWIWKNDILKEKTITGRKIGQANLNIMTGSNRNIKEGHRN